MNKAKNCIFGKKAIAEAIKNKVPISLIKASKNHLQFVKTLKVKYEIVDKTFFDKLKVNHQEIIAYVDNEIKYIELNQILSCKDNKQIILMLDEIESPQNFGAIIRTSVAFEVDTIIFKNAHQSPINELVIKSSMGATNYINFCKVSNLSYALEKLKKQEFWIYGTSLNEKTIQLKDVTFANKSVIVIGNENKGISEIVLKQCDFLFKIPMNNKVQSLNASVATGIILNHVFNK